MDFRLSERAEAFLHLVGSCHEPGVCLFIGAVVVRHLPKMR